MAKSDILPCVMSCESALVGTEDCKFENERNLEMWRKKGVYQTYVACSIFIYLESGNVIGVQC